MRTKPTKERCKVCGGRIVVRYVPEWVQLDRTGEAVDEGASVEFDSCYCEGCALQYDVNTIQGRSEAKGERDNG